jgi:simple sugar transport system ATP-binding protein
VYKEAAPGATIDFNLQRMNSAMPISASQTPLVEMCGICKSFAGIRALDEVALTLMPGEILGLVGDNSAGKSTLMKILSGTYTKDAGRILFEGRAVSFRRPPDSRSLGIEMVFQDFALCDNMDVSLNMFLGRWRTRGIFLAKRAMQAETRAILRRLNVDIGSVTRKVEGLSGGRQQALAIARAISFGPKVIILDEPTANLSPPAIDRVLELMGELKRLGIAQVIISHRLQDVFAVGDRVMVLKRGRNAGQRLIKETTEDEVLGLIVRGEEPGTARGAHGN